MNTGFYETNDSIPDEIRALALPPPKSPRYAAAPNSPNQPESDTESIESQSSHSPNSPQPPRRGRYKHPPPHPLVRDRSHSLEYYTPAAVMINPRSKMADDPGSDSDSPTYARSRFLPESKTVRRKIQLPADTESVTPADQLEDLTTGEVESDPETPVPPPETHNALQVFSYESSSYLVSSPKGKIHVPRVRTDLTTEPQPGTSQQALGQNPPDQRQLRTKMKTTGHRVPSRPPDLTYPTDRVSRAKSSIQRRESETETDDDTAAKKPTSLPRGPDGRFRKK